MAVNEVDDGKKMKYPKSVFFIVLNEFCERFSYYGMRACLSLYFVEILLYSEDTATVMYHTFAMFAYFFPLIGAMVADSWLGKFRTILYLSMVYAFGQLLLSASSVPALNFPVREISILGLLLIALGTGGIKPCVAAFGGDQFKLPQQEAYLTTFFSLFYFAINSGSLISTFITPILRKDVTCFGLNTCYPLAFLVPCILMTLSIVIFFAGKRLYRVKKPEGNVVFEVIKCISHAIGRKIKTKSDGKREHWLDYADDQYDSRLINDIKSVLKVLKLFIPLPFFWALFDQQGSRWTFQAARMDGEVFGYLIKPDQFQVVNPLFIIIFIPIFQFALWPVFEKFLFLNTPLRKLTAGGFFAGLSFVISGFVELSLEPTYPIQPSSGLAQIRIFNTINCKASITLGEQQIILEGLDAYQNASIPVTGVKEIPFDAQYKDCKYISDPNYNVKGSIKAQEAMALSWAISGTGISQPYVGQDKTSKFGDNIEKSKSGDPKVRVVIDISPDFKTGGLIELVSIKDKIYNHTVTNGLSFTNYTEVLPTSYKLQIDGKTIVEDLEFKFGGVYTLITTISNNHKTAKRVVNADPNSMHMFWLLPQYIVITMGEIMFSITGLEFAFTQAPVTMKSLLQAAWLLTVAFGNLIVVIIAEAHFFDRQVFEFFLFAGLMFVDMLIFAIMARYYVYIEPESTDNSSADDIDLKIKEGIQNDTFSDDL